MTAAASYFDDRGTTYFESEVTDRRKIAPDGIWMLEADQPAGDFPDPPIDELVLHRDLGALRGRGDFGAGNFSFRPGHIGLVAPMAATSIICDNRHQTQVLAIPRHRIKSWLQHERHNTIVDLGPLHATPFRNALIERLLDSLWIESLASHRSSRLFADAALLTLWAELLRQARLPGLELARGGLAPWQVRRSTDFLREHATDTIGLEQLADLVGLSPFHFSRAFKQSTGLPPHRYQLGLRIARAKTLLEATDLPVTEIAFAVGYESSQALARLFRREVGVSPSDYRRQRGDSLS